KCSKKDYLVSATTIKACSKLLEKELAQFPNIKVIMCMGDFAIKAVNYIYKNKYKINPIPSGSTYKIRTESHIFNDIRFLPSYTQTGDSFNLEKSKRQMISEDIRKALEYLK
ncbi:MAG TPA: uracil-DNA glycosylase, partial [Bacillota bacterium]|nr:uracil-DNA glycosylase [Bacillota bacterium]